VYLGLQIKILYQDNFSGRGLKTVDLILFSSPIVFSLRAHAFFILGTIHRFSWSWNDTTVSHWRFHDNRRMNTSTDFLNSKFTICVFECWILLKPVVGAWTVTYTIQYRPCTRSSKPSLQHFTILPCWAFFMDSVFSLLKFCHVINNPVLNQSCLCKHFFIIFNSSVERYLSV
jgi:hypothetical protein